MMIELQSRGAAEVARLPAQVVLANAPAIRRELEQCVANGSARLVLDLASVQFVDSSGLSAMLACVNLARRRGGDVTLLAPTPRVRALIELTRLDDVVVVTDDEATAVACAAGRAAS